MKKVRVLVTDDSALMRKLIPQMLAADESIEVVGTAMDGSFCLKKIEELKPNVVTLDLEMPGMNGIDTLKEIMRREPVPAGDGTLLVDFNYLYNPYCAYDDRWSCPVPPPENWLRVPIRAGEQRFHP